MHKNITCNILKNDPEMRLYTEAEKIIYVNSDKGETYPLFAPVLATSASDFDGIYYNQTAEIHGLRMVFRHHAVCTVADPSLLFRGIQLPNLLVRKQIFLQENLRWNSLDNEWDIYTRTEMNPGDWNVFTNVDANIRRKLYEFHDTFVQTYKGTSVWRNDSVVEEVLDPPLNQVWVHKQLWSKSLCAPDGWTSRVLTTHYDEIDFVFKYPIKVTLDRNAITYPRNVKNNQLFLYLRQKRDILTGYEDDTFVWYTYFTWEIYYKSSPSMVDLTLNK